MKNHFGVRLMIFALGIVSISTADIFAKTANCPCSPCKCGTCTCGGGGGGKGGKHHDKERGHDHGRVGVGVNADLGGIGRKERERNPFPDGGGGGTVNVTNDTPTPPPKTKEKPKKKKEGPPGKWPKPVKDWWAKLVASYMADYKKERAQDAYNDKLQDFFKKSKHHEELKKAIQDKEADIKNYPNDTTKGQWINERDDLKKELAKVEGAMEKDFQQTDDGKKALTEKGDAEKAAADAQKAADEAGKYIDKDAIGEKAMDELEKSAQEKAEEKYLPATW